LLRDAGDRPISAALSSRIVPPDALEPDEIAAWRRFMGDTPGQAAAFLSYPYVLAASKVFHKVRVCVIREGGRPVGFFPFQYAGPIKRAFGIGERVGGELSDYFGLVAAPGLEIDPPTLLRLAGLRALFFTHLDESQQRFGLSGEKPEVGLRMRYESGPTAFWQDLKAKDKKFVSDTERRQRKLVEEVGPLEFVFQHKDPLPELEKLIARKREQYQRTDARDALADGNIQRFLAELSACNAPDCTAILSSLHAGGTWVAAHFGLICGPILHSWFPVYNPELRSYAPGRMLMKAILEAPEAAGLSCIDRGVGDTAAKRDFANEQHFFRRGLWHRPGGVALAFRAGLSVRWRLDKLMADRLMARADQRREGA
jgi:CelD/BcsL family acetyltransferase involved in cellulose biosynthesis